MQRVKILAVLERLLSLHSGQAGHMGVDAIACLCLKLSSGLYSSIGQKRIENTKVYGIYFKPPQPST